MIIKSKAKTFLVLFAILFCASQSLAKSWQDYSAMGDALADDDELMINDVSDTTDSVDGTNKLITFDEIQPRDTDLTSIAALNTAAYGRALLEAANEAAFKSLTNTGDVTGPGPTVSDNAVVKFDGTGGYNVQEEADFVIEDDGVVNASDTPGIAGYCDAEAATIWQITSSRDGSDDADVDFDAWINGVLVEFMSLSGSADSGSGEVIFGKPVTASSVDAGIITASYTANTDLSSVDPNACTRFYRQGAGSGYEWEMQTSGLCPTDGVSVRRFEIYNVDPDSHLFLDPNSLDNWNLAGTGPCSDGYKLDVTQQTYVLVMGITDDVWLAVCNPEANCACHTE